ncbi:protein of unknown function [Nitrospina watsonii]|uniref:Uncharacterized protein n=1 Tax=Nitrospina watsonii TaxID=1323948 RepID=A0ABM9HBN5_9BACT|nr:protein of unknown function [Nitrospina watsonii]
MLVSEHYLPLFTHFAQTYYGNMAIIKD